MTQQFNITVPPSANALWKIRDRRMVKTDRYKAFILQAGWEVKAQRSGKPSLDGPAIVSISLRRPRKNADIDNRIKPVLDALEYGGALVNDKQVTCITAAWADHDGCRVTVGADVG